MSSVNSLPGINNFQKPGRQSAAPPPDRGSSCDFCINLVLCRRRSPVGERRRDSWWGEVLRASERRTDNGCEPGEAPQYCLAYDRLPRGSLLRIFPITPTAQALTNRRPQPRRLDCPNDARMLRASARFRSFTRMQCGSEEQTSACLGRRARSPIGSNGCPHQCDRSPGS